VKTSFSSGSFKTVPSELAKYKLRFNGSARGQMGQGWHGTSRWLYIFYGNGRASHPLGNQIRS